MRALQFMGDAEARPETALPLPRPLAPGERETRSDELPEDAPRLLRNLASTPMALVDLPEPQLLGDDWLVLRTRVTGISMSA